MKLRLSFVFLLAAMLQLQAQDINQQKRIANVESFAKLYGYVRYFHPSDEAADLNWEKFLYYGVKEVENAPNSKALSKKLNELFNPIAPSVYIVQDNLAGKFDINTITPANKSEMKEITWQHYGLGNQDGLYSSIRTNRTIKVKDPKRAGFGLASTYIDAIPYRGKKFRFKGAMKAEVSTGQGQLWMRIDRDNDEVGFFDNMGDRPIKSKEWKEYEIDGKVDQDAKAFAFGGFLVGEGKIWMDKFTLEVEDDGKWTPIPFENESFEMENTKGWYTTSEGYTYTLVKNDAVDGKQSLMINDNFTTKLVSTIFDTKNAFGTYFTKKLGNGLSCIVPLVLMGTETATYPTADALKLQELQKKIDVSVPEQMTAEDQYVRLSGICLAWNVFEHFFPYREEAKLEWTKELPVALKAAYEAKTPKDFGRVLRVLTEKLKDGHVSVSFGEQNYYSMQADAALVEGQIVITKVDTTAIIADQLPLKAGDIILAVDGKPALEYFAKLKEEISGSEQWKNACALGQLFAGSKNSEMILKVKSDGNDKEVHITRKNYRSSNDDARIRKLNNGIYYINIGNTEMKDITAILPELSTAKGIVCDLRGYPKGNHQLISYLLNTEDNDKWMFVPRIIYPDYEKVTYQDLGWNMKPAAPHINAKVVFLTGGGAISYAESYMGFIKHYKLATIVGQPTAGANGNVNSFALPGNYTIRFTGMKVKLHNGEQLHSLGIQPDVLVEQSISGVSKGKDEYLEKALELLK
nr:S41 family peptidase [Pedobacter panaciterrae]